MVLECNSACFTLDSIIVPKEEILDHLSDQLNHLKAHHYIAREQSRYLCTLKADLKVEECTVLMDCSKNYSFVIQDVPQPFYREQSRARVHSIIVYNKVRNPQEQDVCHKSFVVNFYTTDHNNSTVHPFQRHFLQSFITQETSHIEHVHYFTDRAALHYKNRKKLLKLVCPYRRFQKICHAEFLHNLPR